MADEAIKDTASRGKIYRTPVVWIHETEIPSLLALIDVWHSWSRELEDDLAQRLVQRRLVDGLSVSGEVLRTSRELGVIVSQSTNPMMDASYAASGETHEVDSPASLTDFTM